MKEDNMNSNGGMQPGKTENGIQIFHDSPVR